MVDIGLVEELNDVVKWNTTIWGGREREGGRKREEEREISHSQTIQKSRKDIYIIILYI